MSRTVALLLSYLFHPVLMPTLGVAAILALSPYYIPQGVYLLVVLYVFLGTYILPSLLILAFWKLKLVDSIHLANAKERRYPYLLSALFFYMTAQTVRNFPIPDIVPKYLLSGVLLLGLSLILLRFSKISAHMAGLGGLLGLSLYLSYAFYIQLLPVIAIILVVAGLIGTARLILNAHSSEQVYAGFTLGLGCVFAVLYFF
jgi:membrane-associated phospholipid phosphatase